MDDELTIAQLKRRWVDVLTETHTAVTHHAGVYRELKTVLVNTVNNPVDIKEYLPTTQEIARLLKKLDPNGHGSLFHLFFDRFFPANICQVSDLRLDCRDLLDHLEAFDKWRLDRCHLRVVK